MSRRGELAFDAFFNSVYGNRWTQLKAMLLESPAKIARHNQLALRASPDRDWRLHVGSPVAGLADCYEWLETFDLDSVTDPILPVYRMDPASVVAARALGVQPGEQVLDMCAAPGGKSLVLLEQLFSQTQSSNLGELSADALEGRLVANELSAKRRPPLCSHL